MTLTQRDEVYDKAAGDGKGNETRALYGQRAALENYFINGGCVRLDDEGLRWLSRRVGMKRQILMTELHRLEDIGFIETGAFPHGLPYAQLARREAA